MNSNTSANYSRHSGPVAVRRLFGGAGIYADGLMFGLMADSVIYLKVDEQSIPVFQREGMGPFTYGHGGKRVIMPYWRMPDRLYDDPDELARWAEGALAAARRGRGRKQTVGRRASAKRRRKKS